MVTRLLATAIGKAFRRGTVLAGVDLVVHAGEAVAVVGANGAGKTTLLRICAGPLEADTGEVRRAGRVATARRSPGLWAC